MCRSWSSVRFTGSPIVRYCSPGILPPLLNCISKFQRVSIIKIFYRWRGMSRARWVWGDVHSKSPEPFGHRRDIDTLSGGRGSFETPLARCFVGRMEVSFNKGRPVALNTAATRWYLVYFYLVYFYLARGSNPDRLRFRQTFYHLPIGIPMA